MLNSKLAFKTYFLRLSKIVEQTKLHIIFKFQKYLTVKKVKFYYKKNIKKCKKVTK